MSKQSIIQYYNELDKAKRYGRSRNEQSIRTPFLNLINSYADKYNLFLVAELNTASDKSKSGRVRPDGILKNAMFLDFGYWEAKDTKDSLTLEIEKKIAKGYPTTNILFENSEMAILLQGGQELMKVNMQNPEQLHEILQTFVTYEPPHIQEFNKALEKFKEDIPDIAKALRKLIDEEAKTNKKYLQKRNRFLELCKKEINPDISIENIREMLIQHILTADIFNAVFDEQDFHKSNSIAKELEGLIGTFMTRTIRKNYLKSIEHYYQTIRMAAGSIADHNEKQKFLKVIYENFYKVYNPKGADRLGVVYTPNEIVDFMIQSTDHLLEKHFGKNLFHQGVEILDPATGTGTFITSIINYIPKQYLKYKYTKEIHCNEVSILPYYIANLNIEYTYAQRMGEYLEFDNICFVDTLDNVLTKNTSSKQRDLFGLSTENTKRIKRQNERKISVIIGNPPYNAKQENYNQNNANRSYKEIDHRIKTTFIKHGTAQNQIVVYDMYTRFYRWAMDRIDEQEGIVCFITNNSFIESRAFNGFRTVIEKEFDYAYIIDLGGDIRKLSGKDGIWLNEENTIFGVAAAVGIAILYLVKVKKQHQEKCQINYIHPCDIRAKRTEKLTWLKNHPFQLIPFERIKPTKKHDWVNIPDNDFEDLLPLIDKRVKAGKSKEAVFKLFSRGMETARDEWVYDFSKKTLTQKVTYFINRYNEIVERFDDSYPTDIKWSSSLKSYYKSKRKIVFRDKYITESFYRPYTKKNHYSERILNHRLTANHYAMSGLNLKTKNKIISINSGSTIFISLATDTIMQQGGLLVGGGSTQCLPFYTYDKNGNQQENITSWGLQQFQHHYQNPKITKLDIFHYTYAVLHNPAYRKKYELNLKRDFPRLPFYDDFEKWVKQGKELMNLHIDYETITPYPLTILENEKPKEKPKVKLKANKGKGEIVVDENTTLTGIPALAWTYKLGNRSALEWVLGQYKEKKPRDKTIAEKFNTYRFADYKEQVIDLLKRVCTVSIRTEELLRRKT